MTAILPPATAGAPRAASAGGGASQGEGLAGGDFETFLRMLTTQIRNQDPLNPMEGSDFAVQLATFTGVEQQVRTNELLAGLQGQLGGGMAQFAGWIGKAARVAGPVHFGAQPLRLDVAPDPRADGVFLVARDSLGREVSRESIGPGSGELDWYGRDAAGAKLPDGSYSFTIEQFQGQTRLDDAVVSAYSRVTGATLERAGPRVLLEGGLKVPPDMITGLSEVPPDPAA